VTQRPRSKSYYHRLDLKINKIDLSTTPVCNMNGYLVSKQLSTVKVSAQGSVVMVTSIAAALVTACYIHNRNFKFQLAYIFIYFGISY
jgi:hypothetical protein